MRNLFTTEPQRAQRNDMTFTAETQRERQNIPPHLNPLPQGARRKGLCKLILVLGLALMTTACDKKPVDPTAIILFSGSTPGNNSVYMSRNSSLSSGNTLSVDIKVNNVSNVYGAAFDVDFDSSKMTYDSYSAGSLLESGGNAVSYQAGLQSGNSGKLIAGISRQAGASGVSGSGILITLKFKVTGNSAISFSNNSLKDSTNQSISGVTWSGGTVTVQ